MKSLGRVETRSVGDETEKMRSRRELWAALSINQIDLLSSLSFVASTSGICTLVSSSWRLSRLRSSRSPFVPRIEISTCFRPAPVSKEVLEIFEMNFSAKVSGRIIKGKSDSVTMRMVAGSYGMWYSKLEKW